MKACNRDTIFRHLQRDFIQSVFSSFYVAFNLLIVFICFCWYFIFEGIHNKSVPNQAHCEKITFSPLCVCVFGLKMKGLKTWLFSADLMENQRNSCTFTAAMNLLILEHGSLDSVSFQIFFFYRQEITLLSFKCAKISQIHGERERENGTQILGNLNQRIETAA